MDIMHLIDRLEELFNESRPIPFTHNVVVDEDRMLDIIDQMRVAIPDEVKKAQQIIAQRDRVLAQAQEAANRTIQLAKEKSETLLEKEPIVQAAQMQAEEIIRQNRIEAENIRKEADQYVLSRLIALEQELLKILAQVQNGMKVLQPSDQDTLMEDENLE